MRVTPPLGLPRDLKGIAWSLALQNSGMNMIAVFVPLLFLNDGYGITQVCVFYIILGFVKLLADYPIAVYVARKGARAALLAGFILSAAYIVLLDVFVVQAYLPVGYVAAVALGLGNACVWMSQHLYISHVIDPATMGKDLVLLDWMIRIGNLLAPGVGGLLVVIGGRESLLGVATVLTVLSVVPAWRTNRLRRPGPAASRLKLRLNAAPHRDLLANTAFAAHTNVNLNVWPLYLAIVFAGFAEIGGIAFTAGIVSFLVVMIAGRRTDHGRSRLALLEGSVASSLFHLFRTLAKDPVMITLVSAGSRTAGSYQRIAWTGTYYAHAKRQGQEYVALLELSGDVGTIAIWVTLLVAWISLGSAVKALTTVFVLGAISAFSVMAVTKKGEVKDVAESVS